MQIVIDIPDEMYDWLENGFPDEDDAENLWQIVKNGTPLPKGHGAIEVLEQEPCGDAISRQAVIDALCNGCELFKNGEQTCFTKCEEYHFLVTLPPVTPQPKIDVLDKIRTEIETEYGQCDICEYFENYDYEENDISEYRPIGNIADILQIIDKHRAESEG